MNGSHFYIFKCGCSSYELKKKRNNAWVCPEHKTGIKEIHSFCQICGLHIVDVPEGRPKLFCEYPMVIQNRYGKLIEVDGCKYLHSRELMRNRYRKKSKSICRPKLIKKIKKSDNYYRVDCIKDVLKTVYPVPAIPETLLIDQLWSQKQKGAKNEKLRN